MKTIKQIADEIGVDKQRAYRFIRKHHIIEAHQKHGVMYYGEAAEKQIKQYFIESGRIIEPHHESHQTKSLDMVLGEIISTLKLELEIKNTLIAEQQKTIGELTAALENTTASLKAVQGSLQAEQALHAGTMQKQITEDDDLTFVIPEINIRPSKIRDFFRRTFRR